MSSYSEDSSDVEKNLFTRKSKPSRTKHANCEISEEVSTAHGLVVTDKSLAKKSAFKRSRNKSQIDSFANSGDKNQSKQNDATGNCHSSEDERSARPNTTNIKVERFSSGAESENGVSEALGVADRAKKNLFDIKNAERIVDRETCTHVDDSKESETRFDRDSGKKSPKRRHKVSVKSEVILSGDDEGSNYKDPDKSTTDRSLSPRKNLSGSKSSEEKEEVKAESGDESSDNEIPPSQFWINRRKEVKKRNDERASIKVSKKSSPTKNIDTGNSADSKRRSSLNVEFNGRKESRKRSPPRITKMEIVSTKYERLDRLSGKLEDDSSRSYDGGVDAAKLDGKDKEERMLDGSGESGGDDDQSDENMPNRDENYRENRSDEDSRKKLSPGMKKQSPKKTQAPSKQNFSLKPEILDNDCGIEEKSKSNEKTTLKFILNDRTNDESVKTRTNICDDDTASDEEEKCKKRQGTTKNYVLGLERPKDSGNKTFNSHGKQQLSSRKASISRPIDTNHESTSQDTSDNEIPGSPTERKQSPERKKRVGDSTDEAEASVSKATADRKQQTIERRRSTESASPTLKRKSDSDDGSSDEKVSQPRNVAKSPSKRKHTDGISPEIVSNKRAKPTPSFAKPEYASSDSDETDSLTELNTTLNKSMALMENKSERVKPNKSRKSVSISTRHDLMHKPNDVTSRKSILKKPKHVATDDNNENDSSTREQHVPQNHGSVNAKPMTIKRPLNLRDLEEQEGLACDSTKVSFGLGDISDDDEIYILDVPKTIDPKELKGRTIRLGGKNKIQMENQLYETCSKDAPNISCVFAIDRGEQRYYKTVNIKPAGCINVRQKLSKTLRIELSPHGRRIVPFPEKLRIRHPLFGAEYKDKIIVPDKVMSRKTQGRSPTKAKSIIKTNRVGKIEKRSMRSKDVEGQEFIKSENNSKDEAGKTRHPRSNDSVSSGSDSDASFFQQIKQENAGNFKRRESCKNLSSILKLDETPLTANLPVNSEETVITVKREKSMKNLDTSSKHGKFFSSTPMKREKDDKTDRGEISNKKVDKRKNRSDSVEKTKSGKKLKTNQSAYIDV